ncbi:MAG: tryptophan--tRNA ligase [Candidatus Aenigmarchaeota archaeon]|nr:tryptophan--tRNA ligase [Candidatus Aenigmarchaeota archaeon]
MAERLDPWSNAEVKDYEHLYKEFGIKTLGERERLDHIYFRRGIAVAHRDFDLFAAALRARKPVYCMTGIASSGKMHIGHMSIVQFVKFFKEQGADVRFAVADIDAYVSRERIATMAEAKEYAVQNLAHVLALGVPKGDVYVQSRMPARYYELAFEISKKFTENMFRDIYGHLDPGKMSAVFLQIADILYPQLDGARHGVVPIALDQDPHIRAARDVAKRLPYGFVLPSSVYVRHVPALKGPGSKMSSSDATSAIYLDDTPEEVEMKVKKYAFSGGAATVDEHRKHGGNPDVDVAFQLLKYFEKSDARVERVYEDYKSGALLTGELKQATAELLKAFFVKHHKRLSKARKAAERIMRG